MESVEILNLINAERAKAGIAPLVFRPDIMQACLVRAEEASKLWSHTRPNGKPYWTADEKIWGENLAKHCKTAQETVTAWMGSELHRKNILNAGYKGACVGIQGNYISLEFTR